MQVILAKAQQTLPESKRDGENVRLCLWSDLMFAENSTARYEGVFQQAELIPRLIQRLRESPQDVLDDFESIRKHSTVDLPLVWYFD